MKRKNQLANQQFLEFKYFLYTLLAVLHYDIGHGQISSNQQFSLTGIINYQKTGKVTLSYINPRKEKIMDTAILNDGKFYFAGIINEPTLCFLRGDVKSMADDDPNAISFYIEPANMDVVLEYNNFKKGRVAGSKTQAEYDTLKKEISLIRDTGNYFFEKLFDINYQFVQTYPSSYVSGFQLALFASRWSIDTVQFLYNLLDENIKESKYGKEVYELLEKATKSLPGHPAPAFASNDVKGSLIKLSDFEGKYVLLDFWASWCIPCRQSTPQLINIFNQYHIQGLEIIGIADDDDNANVWKDAINKDGSYIWYNILRGSEQQANREIDISNSINDLYGVRMLPTKILIDRKGIIIGRYEGTEAEMALKNKLKEIFQ